MSIDTAKSPIRVVLDTNIIISAVGFGGKPREILELVLNKKFQAFTSPTLLAELDDVIMKKFPKLSPIFPRILKQVKKKFKIIKPRISIHTLSDEPDNRVLEAAIEGRSTYIITGDKDLLTLQTFQNIKIVKADEFLLVLCS